MPCLRTPNPILALELAKKNLEMSLERELLAKRSLPPPIPSFSASEPELLNSTADVEQEAHNEKVQMEAVYEDSAAEPPEPVSELNKSILSISSTTLKEMTLENSQDADKGNDASELDVSVSNLLPGFDDQQIALIKALNPSNLKETSVSETCAKGGGRQCAKTNSEPTGPSNRPVVPPRKSVPQLPVSVSFYYIRSAMNHFLTKTLGEGESR